MSKKNSIVEWYNGKSVFVTGGSGFMGKVLIEKLLFSCTGIREIYVLMRSKKGKSPESRLQEMWKLPVSDFLLFTLGEKFHVGAITSVQ